METPAITDWSSFPDDMVDKILGSLSLWELAHISATCKQFYQIFRQNLIKEQKARCDLAIQRFGRQRVSSIVGIANRFVKGLPLVFGGKGAPSCLMSQDGKLHGVEKPWGSRALRDAIRKDGDMDVTLEMYNHESLRIVVHRLSSRSKVSIYLHPNYICRIYLFPCGDDDMEGVALVQALLSGGTAKQDWPRPQVFIEWVTSKEGFTPAGLQTQMGPLLPLASVSESW